MSKFIIRVEMLGYRDYEVEANNQEQARDVYFDNILDSDKVKQVDEKLCGDNAEIVDIKKKENHIHYR